MKLLLVDNDSSWAKILSSYLSPLFEIVTVPTGEEGIYAATNDYYDIAILELQLPDMNGLSVCKQIRKKNTRLPLIFVTWSTSLDDKIEAFDLGCDDFITKPVYKEEITARIHSLLRRLEHWNNKDTIKIDDIELDLVQKIVYIQGKKLSLRPKDFDLLTLLIRYRGKIVKREHIHMYIWGDEKELSDTTIDVHMNYLREHIDKPFNTQHIRTIRSIGFMFL